MTKHDFWPVLIYLLSQAALMPLCWKPPDKLLSTLAFVPNGLAANASCEDEVTCLPKTIIGRIMQQIPCQQSHSTG